MAQKATGIVLDADYKRRLIARLATSQGGLCCYCKRTLTAAGETKATLEHKKAKMDGGKDRVGNFAAACLHCNGHRGRQMVVDRNKAKKAKKAKLTDADRHERFVAMAKEVGASGKPGDFDRAFQAVAGKGKAP